MRRVGFNSRTHSALGRGGVTERGVRSKRGRGRCHGVAEGATGLVSLIGGASREKGAGRAVPQRVELGLGSVKYHFPSVFCFFP